MADPSLCLPEAPSEERVRALVGALGLPQPAAVTRLPATAAYHTIMLLAYPHLNDLVLRVSGKHLPRIKTQNEVAVTTWVAQNTSIPVPFVVDADDTEDNPLGAEYTLLTRLPGQPLSDVWATLSPFQQAGVLDTVADYLAQLHAVEWQHIGGLAIDNAGRIAPGPAVDENFWQAQEIAALRWPAGETVASLNALGPFASYIDYSVRRVATYVRLIDTHPSLAFMRPLIPTIEAFAQKLQEHDAPDDELNRVKLRLAHRDLHFPNLMYDAVSRRVTGVLDWEFSGVVPFTKWDPAGAFLWDGARDAGAIARKQLLVKAFRERCRALGVEILKDAGYSSSRQRRMQEAVDLLRAIVEVCPRGEKADLVPKWRDGMLRHMSFFVDAATPPPAAVATATATATAAPTPSTQTTAA